jgi:hypothetical protein
MKYDARKMAGYAPRSVRNRPSSITFAIISIAALVVSGVAAAQALYKYRGENGEWIYSDRPPDDGQDVVEVRSLTPSIPKSGIKVRYEMDGTDVQLVATNEFFAPVELALDFVTIEGLEFPHPDDHLRWVIPARSDMLLVSLGMLEDAVRPFIEYRYEFLVGDPTAQHAPPEPYRVPFAIAGDHPVSQAYPDLVTHTTPDSRYAVDIAMPVGTDIFAARSGTVFDVSAKNFKGGTDALRDMSLANLVRILHDDGTYAVYAHLNLNSIRVQVGDSVDRGEYIAESGNTGYSSGPHLHFVVVRNVGMAMDSVAVEFEGANASPVTPATGQLLTAY